MHASKLSLIHYRNFSNAKFLFKKGVNTIIGENGSGKTNLFRAMRLLLDDRMVRAAYRLEEQDFCRNLPQWKGHWIIISIEFEEISQDEPIQSLFLHNIGNIDDEQTIEKATYNLIFRPKLEIRQNLSQIEDGDHNSMNAILESICIDDYETIFTGRSIADFNDKEYYKKIVGDFENAIFSNELDPREIGMKLPKMLSLQKDISFTFIQALRDVVSEFRDNRTNPLLTLLKRKSGEIDQDSFQFISDQITTLNNAIEALDEIQDVSGDIGNTIKDTVGETYSPSSLSIKSALSGESDKLFQSLKLFVGESGGSYEDAIHELSLGGANLIYLTLKLLEFKYQNTKDSFANFLLIEEPEAHIHTHIQKALFDKLNFPDTQIIYSTHSTHISEVSNIQNINILGRAGTQCEVYQPCIGLTDSESESIQRYLDAVRNNLLFAKSVILVEGDAKEILIPFLIKQVLGVSLDELGISVVNIRSTGFKNIALLFHDTRIKKRCAIITDLDKSIINTDISETDSPQAQKFKRKCKGSEVSGSRRKDELDKFSKDNNWISVFYASHTFEVDFVGAGNTQEAIGTLNSIYTDPSKIESFAKQIESKDVSIHGRRTLMMAEAIGKGWFAIAMSKNVTHKTIIPRYILDAIFFANPSFNPNIWFDILQYRFNCMDSNKGADVAVQRDQFILVSSKFKKNSIDFAGVRDKFLELFPEDQIVHIMGCAQI